MLSKKVNHGRLKDKKESTFGLKKPFKGKSKNRKGSTKSSFLKPVAKKNIATTTDKDYLAWLQTSSYVCFVCGCFDGIEWHHVKEFSSDKKNHKRLIPLCGIEHHRLGQKLSAHGTPKKWRATYSMDEQNAYAEMIHNEYLRSM